MKTTKALIVLATAGLLVGCGGDGQASPSGSTTGDTTISPPDTSEPSEPSESSEPSDSIAESVETSSTPDAGTPSSTSSVGAVEMPDTPAGDQLRWVLDEAATADDAAYADHFSEAALRQIPAASLREQIAATDVGAVVEVLESTETELVVLASATAGDLVLTIVVEPAPPHLITGLDAQPAELPEPPATWETVEALLAEQAPQWSYAAVEVEADGDVVDIRSSGADVAVPLGSGFKVYVLGAVLDAIERGELAWDDEMTITDELKSLPSGELQERPSGSTVTVREAAEKMIQISDNTATDLLIDRVGRDRVEAMLEPMGMGDASRGRTLPFLTTRELFTIKWGIPAEQSIEYSMADVAERRSILAELPTELPAVADVTTAPRLVDSIEWFASPREIVAAHVFLDGYRDRPGFEPLDAVIGSNPGLPLDPAIWPRTSFKGGSEPGVLFLGWLLTDTDGRRIGIVVAAHGRRGADRRARGGVRGRRGDRSGRSLTDGVTPGNRPDR